MPDWSDLTSQEFDELLRLGRMYDREARRAGEGKAHLAGCVMAGAALEAILIAMVHLYSFEVPASAVAKSKGKAKKLLDWTFADLLKAARAASWLPAGLNLGDKWNRRRAEVGDYAEALRQTRNLVHPSRYVQDHSPSRVTKRYLSGSLETLEAAVSHLELKVHASLRKKMKEEAAPEGKPTFRRSL